MIAPYTPVESNHFKEMPYQVDEELNNHIDFNITKHKCCDGKVLYSISLSILFDVVGGNLFYKRSYTIKERIH
jgi:hypothetical protein